MNPLSNQLLDKLAPLMPGAVKNWRYTLETADTTVKQLVEQQIQQTARRHLGDYHRKLLLSLPPEKTAKGTIQLGTVVYERDKWPAGISASELLQNLAIFGRSGAGKTNVAFHLLGQLVHRGIPVLFLDWKRTARHLLPQLSSSGRQIKVFTAGRSLAPLCFNPFIPPPGMERHIYINHVIDMLADAYTLGDGARSILQETLTDCYASNERWPTVRDVLNHVAGRKCTGRATGWQISAVRALRSLDFAKLSSPEETDQAQLVTTLLRGTTIIELDALNQGAKKFLIPLLCLWIYSVQLSAPKREQLQLVIFVEEAHHVLYRHEQRTKETAMNMLFRQCREIGIGMIVIDQHPHLISSAALGNTYTSICLNQKDPVDITRAAQLSLVAESEKRWFSMLPVGRGIVKLQDRWREPFVVHFPHMEVAKGLVTDDLLAQFLEGKVGMRELKRVRQPVTRHDSRSDEGRFLTEDEFVFLHDVMKHPDDGVKARYQRLSWSGQRGHAVKVRLVKRNWLNEQTVEVGRSRKRALTVPKTAQAKLALDTPVDDRASLVHEYWKRYYAALFQVKGYRVELEASCRNGRVDVLASKSGKRIGIEIETGKSDAVSNVRKCLLSGFDKIIVVAADEEAMRTVERQLAKARLIILARVRLVLRDRENVDG